MFSVISKTFQSVAEKESSYYRKENIHVTYTSNCFTSTLDGAVSHVWMWLVPNLS